MFTDEAKNTEMVIDTGRIIILWLGVNEWEYFSGSLEEAISDVKNDRRYRNYGRKGAIIITGQTLYEIDEYGSERAAKEGGSE